MVFPDFVRFPRFVRSLFFILLGLTFTVAIAACSAPTPQAVAPGSTMRVAVVPNYPPFASKTADGQLQGFEIDLMNAFAEATQTQMEYVPLSFFDDVMRELYGNEVDMAIAAITITPERQRVADFSRPYFKSGMAIAVRDSETSITNLDSLAGKRIGVETGTVQASIARTIPNATVIGYDSSKTAWNELLQGKVDAVISGETAASYAIQTGSVRGMKLAGEPFTDEFLGIAMPKNSPNREFVNSGLASLIDSGKYAELYRKWFDRDPRPLPEKIEGVGSDGVPDFPSPRRPARWTLPKAA
ncbi:transporter substrate-binding domain-containing protein [Thermoleptolyngbya sp. PKUAC-SCTB121]|uniref:transporter substrate-binding domain-containing protein n=1 Tax=Thermoleptolyngbya sp. PKUAC-SCTB121 TaxID=2811482 RepID=UPI0019659906|nr:transporter substrate-binding domain-containing protein [Thermoleptolyngbya sp. PKUAC-SCTB121]